MILRHGVCGLLVVLGGLFLFPSSASAKIVLITRGETINHVADIPQPTKNQLLQEIRQQGGKCADLAVGFRYRYFGVFWLDFWTWGGQYCTFHEKTPYHDLSPNKRPSWPANPKGIWANPSCTSFPSAWSSSAAW